MSVKISVIVPVYNVEKYLADCLDSIEKQEFDSFEVICVDDVSQDGSMEIVGQYQKRYDNIRVLHHSCNMGLSEARNTGMRAAEGEYILFVDSDDYIEQGMFSELYDFACEKKCDMVLFNYQMVYEDSVKNYASKSKPSYKEYEGVYKGTELFLYFDEDKAHKMETWRSLYRKDFLIGNHIQFYKGILHEDFLFYYDCMSKAEQVANMNKDYYVYRQRANSICHDGQPERHRDSLFIIITQLFDRLQQQENIKYFPAALYGYYRSYSRKCEQERMQMCDGSQEQFLYDLLYGYHYVRLTKRQIEYWKGMEHIVIYGAGRYAEELTEQFRNHWVYVESIVVDCVADNPRSLCNVCVRDVRDYLQQKESVNVIIGLTEKHRAEIRKNLENMGFCNIFEIR